MEQTSVTIPNTVSVIGEFAFYSSKIADTLIIPDDVTSIGKYAFSFCTSLTSVIIPDSVTSIGDHVFYNCGKIASLTIGNSVESIGQEVFSGSGLTVVTFERTTPPTFGDNVFGYVNTNPTIYVPAGCGDAYKAVITPSEAAAKVVEKQM